MRQRLLPAAPARWRQWGKPARGPLGRDSTPAEVCTHRPGAHMAYETTRVIVALGDPVIWCLAGTGRGNGRGICRALQMAEDLANDLTLRDDGDEPQGPTRTKRAVRQVQAKDSLEQPRPAPAWRRGAHLWRVEALLPWGREDRPTQVAVRRQTAAIAHQMDVGQGDQCRELLQE